jgi:hypothetical protein
MTLTQIIYEIKTRFEKALEAKTGWGRNEIKTLHDKITIEVLTENVRLKQD